MDYDSKINGSHLQKMSLQGFLLKHYILWNRLHENQMRDRNKFYILDMTYETK
jgi:hypothetical protein